MVYDSAIIGTGAAGISAALNLKVHEKNFIWIGSKELSGKISKAERIFNYPGLPGVSGEELCRAFLAQIKEMDIAITERMVTSVLPMNGHYALMAGADFYEAETVILTTGTAAVHTLPGEQELLGKGVSYCATCDGGLYRGRTVAVICGSARFEHEARYLAQLAANVYYLPQYRMERTFEQENITIVSGKAVEIMGEERVSGVRLDDGSILKADGVFCLRDSIAPGTLFSDLKMENGHIAVDRSMAASLPGVYAAGDCTGRPYQYAKAVGEGNIAAHSVIEYLEA